MTLQFVGFEQRANTRRYIFTGVESRDAKRVFMMDLDMALLGKHHVSLQEGPRICYRMLSAALEAGGAAGEGAIPTMITGQDLVDFQAATAPLPNSKGRPRR